MFWSTTILCVVVQLSGLFFLQETYAPVLLQRKATKLRKETGDEAYYTQFDREDKSLPRLLGVAFIRPFRMILTQPIVQVISRESENLLPKLITANKDPKSTKCTITA